MTQPLAGRRILVTRAAHQARRLSDALRLLGAEPVEVPILSIVPIDPPDVLDAAILHLGDYDWLILTSANAVSALLSRPAWLSAKKPRKVAAIGPATARTANDAGLHIDCIPETYTGEGLVAALGDITPDQRVLLVRARMARDIVPDALRAQNAVVHVVDAYQTVIPEDAAAQLRQALSTSIDATTFTSSSSVRHLEKLAGAAQIAWPLAGIRAISIGPITSATLRELGWEPDVEAEQANIVSLAAATVKAFCR